MHADLASNYDGVRATLREGELFRAEAVAAAAAAVLAASGLLSELNGGTP